MWWRALTGHTEISNGLALMGLSLLQHTCVPCVVVSDAALQASALCGKSHASAVCGPLHSDFKELCCNSCPTSHWAIVRSTDWARGVESSGSKFGAGSLGLCKAILDKRHFQNLEPQT